MTAKSNINNEKDPLGTNIKKNIALKDQDLEKICNEISQLSYEESLKKLDLILEKLKNHNLLVEDLQKSFLQGSLYIQHCEKLLDKIEQEVLEINIDDFA